MQMEKYTLKQIKTPLEQGGWVQALLNIANEVAISNGYKEKRTSIKLNDEENKFFEEAYGYMVKLGVHEDHSYDLVKVIMKKHFERLRDAYKFT